MVFFFFFALYSLYYQEILCELHSFIYLKKTLSFLSKVRVCLQADNRFQVMETWEEPGMRRSQCKRIGNGERDGYLGTVLF